jgi:hypothetical protein
MPTALFVHGSGASPRSSMSSNPAKGGR